ncbi:hypothetical protein ACFV19_33790 [Streptomyces griseoluteus]|uniref:hypothetical protein n=1 Tax=Streptomyces griseoluteus TaxID=29306 RepID=UPI0036A0E8A0
MCTVLCRAAGDTVLTCPRDLDVLDEPVNACVGIDPARHLTAAYADPDPNPPSPVTHRLLTWTC